MPGVETWTERYRAWRRRRLLASMRDYRYILPANDVLTWAALGGLLGSPLGWAASLVGAAALGVPALLVVSYRLAREDAA